MKKTSLTRALLIAGVMAAAGGMAQADAIFYPDGTHVELGANGVESGLASAVLARSSWTAPDSITLAALGVTADQNAPVIAASDDMDGTVLASSDLGVDATTLGAGPVRTTTTTVVTTTPVYVFPNIDFDPHTVLLQPHPMLSHIRSMDMDRTAAATFNTPTRAGEASTMTSGAPNLVTDNPVAINSGLPAVEVQPNTTELGAGSRIISQCSDSAMSTGNCSFVAP